MSSAKLSVGQGAKTGAVRERTVAARAQRGAELELARTAGPETICQMLEQMERNGEVVARHDVTAEPRGMDLDDSWDVEMDLEDKDSANVEVWEELRSPDAAPGSPGFTNSDVHQLAVADDKCSFNELTWAWTFNPKTSSAKECLNEIGNRSRVFSALAEWLTEHRRQFLRSRDLWELGPRSLEEAGFGCAVLQKDLLAMLRIRGGVRKESFSRYLTNCWLVWPDGQASIDILFCKEARLAWVAKAVKMFMEKNNLKSCDIDQAQVRSAGEEKGAMAGMSLPGFAQWAAHKADSIKWEEVYSTYKSYFSPA